MEVVEARGHTEDLAATLVIKIGGAYHSLMFQHLNPGQRVTHMLSMATTMMGACPTRISLVIKAIDSAPEDQDKPNSGLRLLLPCDVETIRPSLRCDSAIEDRDQQKFVRAEIFFLQI